MRNILKSMVFVTILSFSFLTHSDEVKAEKNYFQFAIPKYQTQRQSGQIVNIYVRYAYKKNLNNHYPDYRILRKHVLSYMKPTDELPAKVYWERIAEAIGKSLMKEFPLDGVSVQLIVLDNQNPNAYEPGDHGPIFTMGNISPLVFLK